jgi:hypothetical protein
LIVINCANISLPHGTLLDCYDELGTRYQVPVYILSSPTNLIDGEQSSINDNESGTSDIDFAATAVVDRERDLSDNQQQRKSSIGGGHNPIVREIKKHRRKQKANIDSSGNESSSTNTITPPVLLNPQQSNLDQDTEIPIKFRLSNGKEHRLYCKPNEKVRNIKRRLAMLENGVIDSQTQRLFFGGKLLRMLIYALSSIYKPFSFSFSGDRIAISETRLQRNFVVQVILQDQPVPPNGAITTTGHLMNHHDHVNYSVPVELPDSSLMKKK